MCVSLLYKAWYHIIKDVQEDYKEVYRTCRILGNVTSQVSYKSENMRILETVESSQKPHILASESYMQGYRMYKMCNMLNVHTMVLYNQASVLSDHSCTL